MLLLVLQELVQVSPVTWPTVGHRFESTLFHLLVLVLLLEHLDLLPLGLVELLHPLVGPLNHVFLHLLLALHVNELLVAEQQLPGLLVLRNLLDQFIIRIFEVLLALGVSDLAHLFIPLFHNLLHLRALALVVVLVLVALLILVILLVLAILIFISIVSLPVHRRRVTRSVHPALVRRHLFVKLLIAPVVGGISELILLHVNNGLRSSAVSLCLRHFKANY